MKLWTIKEVVKVTGLSRSTVRRAIKSGELESRLIKGTRQRRIMHEWLVEWLNKMDPIKGTVITIEETIERKGTITKTKMRIEQQLPLFDKPAEPS